MASYENVLYDSNVSSATRDFIEETKLNKYNYDAYGQQAYFVMKSPYYYGQVLNNTLELGLCEEYELRPDKKKINSPHEILKQLGEARKSVRFYQEKPLDMVTLSNLLCSAYFLQTNDRSNSYMPTPRSRNIASPGALYPVDLYYINLRVTELPKGVYHFNLHQNKLQKVNTAVTDVGFMEKIKRIFWTSEYKDLDFDNASGIIIPVGCINRVAFKYQDRGVRWMFLESGEIIHSLYLNAAALKLGVCACAGYFDDELADLLNLKSNDFLPIVSMLIGHV